MNSQYGTANFQLDKDSEGDPIIRATGSWLGPNHGWNVDKASGCVYQKLPPCSVDALPDLDKLPILNVLACPVIKSPSRASLEQALGDGKTLQTNWSWEQVQDGATTAGTLKLSQIKEAGALIDYKCTIKY